MPPSQYAPGGAPGMSCTACNTKGIEQLACSAGMKFCSVSGKARVRKSRVANGRAWGVVENTTRSSQAPSARRCATLLAKAPR